MPWLKLCNKANVVFLLGTLLYIYKDLRNKFLLNPTLDTRFNQHRDAQGQQGSQIEQQETYSILNADKAKHLIGQSIDKSGHWSDLVLYRLKCT